MIYKASEFVFRPPPVVTRARRIVIKPYTTCPEFYPVSTSAELLRTIISGIRRVSDADVVLLGGTPNGDPIYPVYHSLGYKFPRVLTIDVQECIWVEVDNPLPKPLAIPTFWIPNIILSSDYLISVTPLQVIGGQGQLSISNLMSVLPAAKYPGWSFQQGWGALWEVGIEKALADLYYTLPFDLGIIETRQKYTIPEDERHQEEPNEYGKIFVGEPYQVDREVCETIGITANYLNQIQLAEVNFEA